MPSYEQRDYEHDIETFVDKYESRVRHPTRTIDLSTMCIVTEKRRYYWLAHLLGDEKFWVHAETENEAIDKLYKRARQELKQ